MRGCCTNMAQRVSNLSRDDFTPACFFITHTQLHCFLLHPLLSYKNVIVNNIYFVKPMQNVFPFLGLVFNAASGYCFSKQIIHNAHAYTGIHQWTSSIGLLVCCSHFTSAPLPRAHITGKLVSPLYLLPLFTWGDGNKACTHYSHLYKNSCLLFSEKIGVKCIVCFF